MLMQSRAAVRPTDNTNAANNSVRPNSSDKDQRKNSFDKKMHSLDAADSIWVIANKIRPLQPTSYIPEPLVVPAVAMRQPISGDERRLRQDTATALEEMFAAAQKDGVSLKLLSGYRSYAFQNALYNRYVSIQGQATADLESARPGHSEHQTGLAADIGGISNTACDIEACFTDTIEGKWIAENAYVYGFVIRYPQNKTAITGYIFEPWHVRFVGSELAYELQASSVQTLEEYFNLPASANYN